MDFIYYLVPTCCGRSDDDVALKTLKEKYFFAVESRPRGVVNKMLHYSLKSQMK